MTRGLTPILLVTVLLGGCSMRPLVKIERTGSSREQVRPDHKVRLDSCVVAVGGVFLSPAVKRDHLDGVEMTEADFTYREQADRWSHLVLLPLTVRAEEARHWSWSAVEATVPAAPLEAAVELFAAKAVLRAERLTPLGQALPVVDLLVMARIDFSLLEDRVLTQPSGMRGSIGRTIEVTLECYDLRTGEPVWRSTRKSHAFGAHIRQAREEDSRAVLMRQADGEVAVDIKGTSVSAPTFDEMLPGILDGLVQSLLNDLKGGPAMEFE